MPERKKTVPLANLPETAECPKCGQINRKGSEIKVQVEFRPVLTAAVFAFPDALADVICVKCSSCGYWMCLDYRIELDDNPEIDLNPEETSI